MGARKSVDNGKRWEAYIDTECQALRDHRQALVVKSPEPLRLLRPMGDGKFLATFTRKSYCDYQGTLAGGRAVTIEAKSTSSDRFQFSQVAKHQRYILSTVARLGGLALVYVLGPDKGKYVLPVDPGGVIAEVEDAKGIALHEELPWRKQYGETWLDTCRRLQILEEWR